MAGALRTFPRDGASSGPLPRQRVRPVIGAINALPEIRGKMRLHLGSALRVVYEAGPEATPGNVTEVETCGFDGPGGLGRGRMGGPARVRKAKGLPQLFEWPGRPGIFGHCREARSRSGDLDVIDRRTVFWPSRPNSQKTC